MTPDLVRDMGWALLHFLWQGAVLALLVPAIAQRCRTATARYNVCLATLALIALAPVATFLVLRHPGGGMVTAAAAPTLFPTLTPVTWAALPDGPSPSWLEGLVLVWLAGIICLSLRMLGGWVLLERLRRRETRPLPDALLARCRALQHRLALARPVRFLQSALVPVPAVIGWFRPAVLIPISALAGLSPAQLDAIILHELAHIKRLDAFANLFQIVVETLLFYHPAVWWVSRRIRVEREHCCDDLAVGVAGDPVGYARALTLLETQRGLPRAALAATGGELKGRVTRLLGMRETTPARLPHLAVAAAALICLIGSVTAGHALTGDPEPAIPEVSAAPETPAKPASYIGAMAEAGLTNLTADQLIALKTQGIDPAYVAAMHKAGFEPSIHELLTLHSVGVEPENAAQFRALGLGDLPIHQLITFKSIGVTPDYIQALQHAGIGTLSANDLVTAKSVGVTPDFIASLRAHGLTDLDLRKVVTLKTTGVF